MLGELIGVGYLQEVTAKVFVFNASSAIGFYSLGIIRENNIESDTLLIHSYKGELIMDKQQALNKVGHGKLVYCKS